MSNLAQNNNTLYLMICHTLRNLRHCSIIEHNNYTIAVLVNSPKKCPFQAKRQFGPNLAQNYSTPYLMICQSCFFLLKHFSMIEHNRLIKVTLVSFPQNIPFSTIVHFGPNLGQIYATLCPRQLCHMVLSLKVLKCSTMG